jgi:hypothetical protein
MNRRSFLQSILAAGVAPWVMSNGVAGGVLMPVRKIIAPEYGESIIINIRCVALCIGELNKLIEKLKYDLMMKGNACVEIVK